MPKKEDLKLDKETIKQIKEDLLKRKAQIVKDIEVIEHDESSDDKDKHFKTLFPEYGDKSDENAQEINEYTTNLATEAVLDKTLRDIDQALERINDGTYGVCKYCQKEVGKKRLLARPVASACVACKTKLQNS